MQAVLLAGGLGTRLRSVVSDRPKPLADVCGKPFLEYLVLELKRHGISDIIMAVGYKGEMIEKYFGDGGKWGISIRYAYEDKLLGTAGAVKNAEAMLNFPEFFVINADTFYQAAYEAVIDLYQQKHPSMILVLRKVPDISRYGSVRTEGCRVTGFNEKVEEKVPGLINGGIYLMQKEILDRIPKGQKCSLENEIIPQLLNSGAEVDCIVNEGYFIDIGIPDDYEQFVSDVKKNKIIF